MACSTPIHNASPYAENKTRMCRFFLGPRGCRDGEDCLYRHIDDRPTCKYYFSKWGCWNGKWCKYRHSEPESEEAETAKQFYKELNEWLGPAKTADDSIQSTDMPVECTTPKPLVVTTAPPKKFVSRGTQTKTTPDFVHCGECGEEFKSSRTLQQSLERHYIHKLASADFHHLRFFKRHPQLQGGDPFCSACGELFGSITELLQHMGRSVSFTTGTASVSVRHEHQSWFKQLVQPFVYRDLEVLETEEDMVQCILDIYFYKKPTTPVATASTLTTAKESPAKVSPMKLARKLQREVNGSLDNVSPYIHCEECGEIFDDPDNDEKLRDHYADMLTRADGLHVKQLRKWFNTQAQCSVCNKTFLSVVALLQHVGSKERVTASNNRISASNHSHLLNDIADVFVGRTLEVEGYITQEDMIGKIQELTWSGEPCHPNEVPSSSDEAFAESPIATPDDAKEQEKKEGASKEPNKKEGVDEALQMARYFCRVNEWQAKMSYPEYVKDDQERTRNYGFTVAEVGYLATKGLTPTSRGVFNVLNSLYRRRRNPLKSVPSMAKEETQKPKEAKPTAKSPKKDVSFSEKPEEAKKSEQSKPEGEDIVETVETVEESEEGSPTKGQKPKPKRKKRVRRRRRSKGGVADQDEVDETAEKKPSSKSKAAASVSAAAANKGKGTSKKDTVQKKRERLLSRDIEGEELNVILQVHMDGTIFVREKLAQAQEEVTPKKAKDDSTLQIAVERSLHDAPSATSITSRVFVVHKDGTIDIVLQVAGIPIDANPIDTPDNSGTAPPVQGTESTEKPNAQIRDNDAGKASPQRDFKEEDSAIIAAKVSPRSAVVTYTGDQRSDVKTQIMNYLLTATTEQETSANNAAKDVPAEQTASPPVAQQSSESGEVVKIVTEENKVKEKTKKAENGISDVKPKDQDIKLEKETHQQDTVAQQSAQPEKTADTKRAESETSSEENNEVSKTQTKPYEAESEDKANKDQKEDNEPEFCMVAVEDVSESSSQKEVPATGCETNEAHAPKDINGNADPAPPGDKMGKEKTVTEVNNNTETVAGVTTVPSECRI